MAQAVAHQQRLSSQHRDLAARGKGSRAARRLVAMHAAAGRSGRGGLSKTGNVKSKAQQRYLFAHHFAFAHRAAKSGAAYKALPTRVGVRKR